MGRDHLIIAVCVLLGAVVGAVVGAFVGLTVDHLRTGIAVGALAGLAIAFGVTGARQTSAT